MDKIPFYKFKKMNRSDWGKAAIILLILSIIHPIVIFISLFIICAIVYIVNPYKKPHEGSN